MKIKWHVAGPGAELEVEAQIMQRRNSQLESELVFATYCLLLFKCSNPRVGLTGFQFERIDLNFERVRRIWIASSSLA